MRASDQVTLTVYGPVRGKQRPRMNTRTGRAYTPQQTKAAEARVREAWIEAGRPTFANNQAITMGVRIVIPRPQTHYNSKGALNTAGLRFPHPMKTPDLDNVLKLVADSLNKLAYADDKQIVYSWQLREWAHRDELDRIIITMGAMPNPPA